MLNSADLFVCVIFFVLQGRLDGFPVSRLSSDRDALSWSIVKPSASSDSLWTFPATRLHESDIRDLISSTSLPPLPAAVTCRHKRILSSNDRRLIPTTKRRSYSSSDKRSTRRTVITRPTQPSPTDGDDDQDSRRDVSSSYSSQQQPRSPSYNDEAPSYPGPSQGTYLRGSSPSYENKSQKTFPMTTSYAMRLHSNFRLSKQQEAPVIVFDQNGKMYTNVYPPIGYRSNDYNKQKGGDGDWSRRYLPKWLVIGGKKS